MRRTIISLLVTGLVIGSLSPWALANRPNWLPEDLKRGGGDDLESVYRFTDGDDPEGGDISGMRPPDAVFGPEAMFGARTSDSAGKAEGVKPASWLWWALALSWLW